MVEIYCIFFIQYWYQSIFIFSIKFVILIETIYSNPMKILHFIKKYEFLFILILSIIMNFFGYKELGTLFFVIALVSITMREYLKRKKEK